MTRARREVKMKHFSFEFNQKKIPESFEERVNVLREIGQKAKKDFDEKYHQLDAWFKDYDALYLLSFCLNYFTAYEEGQDEEVDKGHLEFPRIFRKSFRHFRCVTIKPLLQSP